MVSYNYFLPVKYQFQMIIRTQESRLFHNLRTYRRINGSVRNLSHFLYDLIRKTYTCIVIAPVTCELRVSIGE